MLWKLKYGSRGETKNALIEEELCCMWLCAYQRKEGHGFALGQKGECFHIETRH